MTLDECAKIDGDKMSEGLTSSNLEDICNKKRFYTKINLLTPL